MTLREQIIQQKKNKTENLKDSFYVDYCNNCKDAEIRGVYGLGIVGMMVARCRNWNQGLVN